MSAQVAYLGTTIADWVGELSSSDPLKRRLGAYALGEIGPATFDEVLRTLKVRAILPPEVANLFFHLKRVGNAAVHENVGSTADALAALKIARGAAVWFHQSYGGRPNYKPGPFVPPTPPLDATVALSGELEELRNQVRASSDEAAKALLAFRDGRGRAAQGALCS